ncbi:MAG: tRNA (adenosine(37)-N6)-dimethylallyltransferase MiaA [Candidatus Saccharimonadales bacterium]
MPFEPLVVIVGETGSGKSSLALELAQKFNGEIISADAWAVYKGFDIGTAKPSRDERRQIRHHLIDVANPKTGFSAAEFKRLADSAIEDILKRGKLPILVGGTGLYIDSVIYNYGFLPAGPTAQRQALDRLEKEKLLKIIEEKAIDTTGIDLRNKRRLVRLIESEGLRPVKSELRPSTLIIGLETDREMLETAVVKRVDKMLSDGLETEVKELSQKYYWQTEPMKGIGYREWELYFKAQQNLEQTRQRIVSSSMQLAKKQRTWFKRNKSIHWIHQPAQAASLVNKFLNK